MTPKIYLMTIVDREGYKHPKLGQSMDFLVAAIDLMNRSQSPFYCRDLGNSWQFTDARTNKIIECDHEDNDNIMAVVKEIYVATGQINAIKIKQLNNNKLIGGCQYGIR